jgi:hypothetical protein
VCNAFSINIGRRGFLHPASLALPGQSSHLGAE